MKFGEITDSYYVEGIVIEKRIINSINADELVELVKEFLGEQY